MDKSKAIERAAGAFDQEKDLKEVFASDDAQIFRVKNHAEAHQKSLGKNADDVATIKRSDIPAAKIVVDPPPVKEQNDEKNAE